MRQTNERRQYPDEPWTTKWKGQEVEEDELDPPLLAEVELQALGLEHVAGNPGRVEHVDLQKRQIPLGGVE